MAQRRVLDPDQLRQLNQSIQHQLRQFTQSIQRFVASRRPLLGYSILVLVIAFLVWGIGWPFLLIFWNLHKGEGVKESLLKSLRNRCPAIVCDGGVGYTGPSVLIRVRGTIAPTQQVEIKEFLAAEKARAGFRIETWLEFDPVPGKDWDRHKL